MMLSIYLQSNSGKKKRHREETYGHGERGGEGMGRVTSKLTLPYVK